MARGCNLLPAPGVSCASPSGRPSWPRHRELRRDEKTMHKTTAGAAALSTAVTLGLTLGLTLGITGPASAASIRERDPHDTSHGSDLRAVQVHNGERNLVVVTRH